MKKLIALSVLLCLGCAGKKVVMQEPSMEEIVQQELDKKDCVGRKDLRAIRDSLLRKIKHNDDRLDEIGFMK